MTRSPAPLPSGTNQPGNRGRRLSDLLVRSSAAGCHRIGHAMGQVVVEQLDSNGLERFGGRRHLIEDLDAVLVLLHHALQPADLTLDPSQPLLDSVLPIAVSRHRLEHTPPPY